MYNKHEDDILKRIATYHLILLLSKLKVSKAAENTYDIWTHRMKGILRSTKATPKYILSDSGHIIGWAIPRDKV